MQSGREISYLAVGTRLALLEEWVQKNIVPVAPHEQDFFDASLAERDERAQRELHHSILYNQLYLKKLRRLHND